MNVKNEVLYRVYIVLFCVVMAALFIAFETFKIAFIEGPQWRSERDDTYIRYIEVSAARGNIMAEDGSLLATSLPFFEIRFDPTVVEEDIFIRDIDSLAHYLATYVNDEYTVGGYKEMLINKRIEENRYVLIKRKASFAEKDMMSKLPIFRLGQFKGGFIAKPLHRRMHPFKQLAYRTVGYKKDTMRAVGLEGYFDEVLSGETGRQLAFRAPGHTWIPLTDVAEIEPQRGDDIVTTIDINIQDVTHEALLRALNYHNAEHGTAIVMDVNTGAIKAISNLGRTESGWYEIYNYAIGNAVEPGSTFKLATIMALLEDGYINLDDTIALDQGYAQFYEEEMFDAVPHTYDSTTVKRAFEISSNVGMAKMVQQYYGDTKGGDNKFIKRLKQFNLHLPTGIEIEGEAPPLVKDPNTEDMSYWSGVTLPWMSTGYEVMVTPLQLLTLYNAVANNGTMMKPYLVSEIQHYGKVKKTFKPTIIKKNIASAKTIENVQELLQAVVDTGTAEKLKTTKYTFAGKTGTAQINYRRGRKAWKYRTSFAGYFPADNPKYSCIVMIEYPKQNGASGAKVAGPVFREIADKIYDTHVAFYPPLNSFEKPQLTNRKLPNAESGERREMEFLLDYFNIEYNPQTQKQWAVIKAASDSLFLQGKTIPAETVPSVTGMGLRDALYILENKGLKVTISGHGKVVRQSILPGTKVNGQTIRLSLN